MPEEANKPLVKQSADIPPFASACCQQTKPTNRKTKHGRFWRTKFCFVFFFLLFIRFLVPTWNDYVVLPTVMNRFITKTSSCKKEKERTTSVTNYHPDVVPPPHHFKTLHTNQAAHYYLWKKNTSKLILSQSSQTYFFSIPSPIYEKIKNNKRSCFLGIINELPQLKNKQTTGTKQKFKWNHPTTATTTK